MIVRICVILAKFLTMTKYKDIISNKQTILMSFVFCFAFVKYLSHISTYFSFFNYIYIYAISILLLQDVMLAYHI